MSKKKRVKKRKPVLVFLDNGFFNKFTGRLKDQDHSDWQRYFVDHINALIRKQKGIDPLCAPTSFLEYIWVSDFEQPPFGLTEDKAITSSQGLGESVFQAMGQYIEKARKHFSMQKKLKVGHLIGESNIRRNKHTADSPHAHLFADLTFQKFKARNDFEKEIYLYLAIDALQGDLERKGKNKFYTLAQYQHFKDMLEAMSRQRNVPIFRLIRSLLISVLPQNACKKKVLQLKKNSDRADCDYVHYAVFGYRTARRRRTVNVYTCDPLDKVIFRLRAAKFLYHALAQRALRDTFKRLKVKIPKPMYGVVYVCDPNNPRVIRTVRPANLSFKKLF